MRFMAGWLVPHDSGPSDIAYREAMRVSDDLLDRMRNSAVAGDVNRTLLGALLARRNNIPFLTSVYETIQEMDVPEIKDLGTTH